MHAPAQNPVPWDRSFPATPAMAVGEQSGQSRECPLSQGELQAPPVTPATSPRVTWGLHSSISPAGILKLPAKTVPLQLSLFHCSSEGLKASVSTKGVGIGVSMVLVRTGDTLRRPRLQQELHPLQPNPGSGSSPTCQPIKEMNVRFILGMHVFIFMFPFCNCSQSGSNNS